MTSILTGRLIIAIKQKSYFKNKKKFNMNENSNSDQS